MTKARRRSSLLSAVEQVRRSGENITLAQLLCYLYVCENEGINITELAFIMGVTRATASRTVTSLIAQGSLNEAGSLIESRPNPTDARGRLIVLTAPGRALREQLDRLIAAAHPIVIPE